MRLAYGMGRFEAEADDASDRAWLLEFLGPWFEPRTGAAASLRVTLQRDAAAFEAVRAKGARPGAEPVPAFLADGPALALAPWTSHVDAPRWYDAGADAFVESVAPGEWRVLATPGAHFARVAWMRVLRELATLESAARGAALLHASAIAREGRAIAFVGPKRSGKTSCLLAALRAPGVRFLTNDRLCVEPAEPPRARGMPTIVSLREDARGAYPELAERVREADPRVATLRGENRAGQPEWPRGPGRAGLGTAEFLALAGVEACIAAPLAVLVFPSVSGRPGRYALSRLAAKEALALLRAADLLSGVPASSPFGALAPGAANALIARLAERVACVGCRLDLDAWADPAAWLSEIAALV